MIASYNSGIRAVFKGRLAKKHLPIILVLSFLLTLINAFFQLVAAYRSDIEGIDTQMELIEKGHLGNLSDLLRSRDEGRIGIMLNSMLGLRDIVYLEIYENGQVMYASGRKSGETDTVRKFPIEYSQGAGAREIGVLHAHASYDDFYRRLPGRIWVMLISQGLIIFSVAFCILYIMHYLIMRHLTTIAGHVENPVVTGPEMPLELRRRPVSQPNGLGTLADAINTMRRHLRLGFTKSKLSEEALRRYEQIISSTDDMISFVDRQYRYLAVNDAYLKAYGKHRDEVVGAGVAQIVGVDKFDDVIKGDMDRALAGEMVRYRTWIDFCGIGRRYIDATCRPCRDHLDEINGVIVNFHDLTDRKQAEDALKQAQKIESVGRLAGGVAHDLNNLLSPILGYGQMLMLDADALDPRKDTLKEIVEAALRARDLVRQLLAFSRKQKLEFKSIDLNAMICKFETLLRRTIREDIAMNISLASAVPPVMGDVGLFEQVIMNLSVNAQDAMPHGGSLTIETAEVFLDEAYAEAHQSAKSGFYVMLSISDSGSGMDAQTLEHMFEPFFTTKPQGQGTGLGLATVYGIVKQHSGNIWAYSEPGQGTTFKVYLPVCTTPAVNHGSQSTEPKECYGTEHILLVEDNPSVRSLTYTLLDRSGYKVLVAKSGADALGKLETYKGPLDLVLTDVVMPDMNGKQLYQKVAVDYPTARVLYMSGYTENVITQRGVIDVGNNFISKPVTVETLSTKVREVLDAE